MKRSKKHRIKQEMPDTSTSRPDNEKDHDLAYYIHDRVELMHQVFSVLKPKEIKAMVPECVRHISISNLQELCMEELLGISSKRLCAILDGASAPSDTESSSESEQLETISLDSISSDEEIFTEVSSKKSKKHKHRSKSQAKKRKAKDTDDEDKDQANRSRRAGLTVLELLELQARARAIRAQLQQEQASAVSTSQLSESVTANSSNDEVEIKEEAAEIVEISSEDEKPNIQQLEERISTACKNTTAEASNSNTVTKKGKDLVTTVPQTSSRKIKLKRNTFNNSKATEKNVETTKTTSSIAMEVNSPVNSRQGPEISSQALPKSGSHQIITQSSSKDRSKVHSVSTKDKNKRKDKKKKHKKVKQNDKDGSDHDEITLQLSDTEKMDLLEDLEGKKSEGCGETEDSSSDSTDEESTTEDSDEDKNSKLNKLDTQNINVANNAGNIDSRGTVSNNEIDRIEKNNSNDMQMSEVDSLLNKTPSDLKGPTTIVDKQIIEKDKVSNNDKYGKDMFNKVKSDTQISKEECELSQPETSMGNSKGITTQATEKLVTVIDSENRQKDGSNENAVEFSLADTSQVISDVDATLNLKQKENIKGLQIKQGLKSVNCEDQFKEAGHEINNEKLTEPANVEVSVSDKVSENAIQNEDIGDEWKEKSDGELSDRDSSIVEASDLKPDVVCISDDDGKKEKKKKKKYKKSKKEKKCKKNKDFRESNDQNFYTEKNKDTHDQRSSEKNTLLRSRVTESYDSSSKNIEMIENIEDSQDKNVITTSEIDTHQSRDVKLDERDNLKSKNTNADTDLDGDVYEILTLSDDSSCYEVEGLSISTEPTTEEIEALSAKLDELERDTTVDNQTHEVKESADVDDVSWKERYLKSSKVKKVLTTANIMNALRKKNLELKKKLQESKTQAVTEGSELENVNVSTDNFEDGSIKQYNTLETSNRYVDPVKEVDNTDKETENRPVVGAEDYKNTTGTDKKDTITKEMKRQAKQLLKMYKMLLKYNDISKEKDPNKKKKKKHKKSKDKIRVLPAK